MKPISRTLEYSCLMMVIAITGLALFTNHLGWPLYLELFSHFQAQYFVATLLFAGITLMLRHFRILLIILFCSAVLSAQVLPWYVPTNFSPHGDSYRVLSANLNFSNHNAVPTLTMMAKEEPDLALFIEVNRVMEQQLTSLKTTLPYSTTMAADNGLVLYSKYPLRNVQRKQFGLYARESLVAHVEIDGQPISLVAVHPLPPIGLRMFESRNTLLADVGNYIKTQTEPVILVGDLNTTMWSPYYQSLIQQTGLKNTRQGFGIRPTWPVASHHYGLDKVPSTLVKPLQIPIDHCLVSPNISVTNIHTGTETGSDHLPIIADLAIPSSPS